jgi:hypothetical protein
MAIIMHSLSIITGINLVLLLSLLYVYIRNFIKLRSFFTAGLLIFTFLFIVQNALSFYFNITMMNFYDESVMIYGIILSSIQLVAFLVLNIITWK